MNLFARISDKQLRKLARETKRSNPAFFSRHQEIEAIDNSPA